MSDSRLEKFIYAICSMDVSDLPVPLSRIEKLWNCLITGETPDFEPLSRNEKYLMAMLDRYDISNLPAPMSRGEKLLYKIAVGETDLSDVPGYLSRYEELLKYLIENGGISGGDFEYVLYTVNQSLYTLYTTAEKPVKSAILTGQTLVNLVDVPPSTIAVASAFRFNAFTPKQNTEYTMFINLTSLNASKKLSIGSIGANNTNNTILNVDVFLGTNKIKFITLSDTKTLRLVNNSSFGGGDVAFENVMILEGDYTGVDIPYFTGMQSVKLPVLKTVGKNLIDMSSFVDTGNHNNILTTFPSNWGRAYKLQLKPNTTYTVSRSATTTRLSNNMCIFNGDESQRKGLQASIQQNVTTNDDGILYFSLAGTSSDKEVSSSVMTKFIEEVEYLQVEEGVVATPYEPFKSNILTVNEDVTLRGIGDVQDKLDCLTGEVTESIGEIVLDGTQYMDADGRGIYIQVDDMKKVEDYRTIITCDKLPVFHHQWDLPNVENGIAGYLDEENKYPGQNWLYIKVNNSIDVGEVRQILTQNPITAQYGLSVESIKTVDLTVVDQDNQPTELGTFENVTHVSLEAENLIPEVEMEVATRISTELASASPLMDDISTKQEQLSTTIDEQSENVDATMIATTEIYEETL